MSFALPLVRSASDEGAEARLAGLGLAAIAIALFALAAFSPAVLGDGDTFSHLATGEWIIAHGAAPRADPFSHSMPGAPWVAHEWLSEVLLALAFRLGGWGGVVLMTGAAAASAALIVGLSRRARASRRAARRDRRARSWADDGEPAGAPAYAGAADCSRLERRPPRRARSRPRAAARACRADDPVGEHAWRLHLRSHSDRAVRARGADGGPSRSASRNSARLDSVRPCRARGGAHQSLWRRSAHPAVPPDGDREPVADQRVAAAGLQPSRNDGARAPDADRPHADPAVRDGADPRRAPPRADRDGAAAFAPSGAARHPGADAAGEADRSSDRRRLVRRRAAAGCGDRDRGHGRGRAH